MYQPVPGGIDCDEDVAIDGKNLEQVTKFKYLSSTVSTNNQHDSELRGYHLHLED